MSDGAPGLRSAPSAEALREPALVLASAGIEHRVEKATDGWRLVVAAEDAERAAAAIEAYEHERRPQKVDANLEYGPSYAGFVIAMLLVAFYVTTGAAKPGVSWFRVGSAAAERVLDGELWRTVTALTLHADPAHVLANAVACAVFATAVARLLGPGLGSLLVLLAGAGGNALNAYLHGTHHTSIGASTAVFGAIGILGGLQFGRTRGRRGAWLALAGSLALLAMLGTGERTDLLAHLFGLAAGLVLGMAAAYLPRAPGRVLQAAFAASALLLVLGSWLAAFRFS